MKNLFTLKNTRIVLVGSLAILCLASAVFSVIEGSDEIVKIILVSLVGGIGVWDVFAQLKGGTSSTVSNAVIVFAHQQPWLVFMAGMIAGHLLWRMEPTKEMLDVYKKIGKPTEIELQKAVK